MKMRSRFIINGMLTLLRTCPRSERDTQAKEPGKKPGKTAAQPETPGPVRAIHPRPGCWRKINSPASKLHPLPHNKALCSAFP